MKNLLPKTFNLAPQKGFTLLELLLVIALMGAVSLASLPIYLDFMTRNDLDVAVTTSAHAIRRANLLAKASEGDRQWGIHFANSKVTIFKCPASGGCTYSGRNVAETDYDEDYEISSKVTVSGVSDYLFTKKEGQTTSGTTTLTSGPDSKNLNVTIYGTASY